MNRALVVFCQDDSHPLSWILKRGFRHCFVCLEQDGHWYLINGGPGVPSVKYLTAGDFDLESFYESKGMITLMTHQRTETPVAPWVWRNCVGLVKGMLCLPSWALTPYQLHRYLRKHP